MDRQLISLFAHADHPIAAPLSAPSVRSLIGRAVRRGDEHLLDLGCGGGAWLLLALTDHPRATADGVDVSAAALAWAEEAAAEIGVSDRITLHEADVTTYEPGQKADVVLSVGASHAFGGLLPTLGHARRHLAPGGRVIVGDGYWERSPGPRAVETLGELLDLPETVARVTGDGWLPVYGHTSTREELDDYEWSWTGTLTAWALDNSGVPGAAEARALATSHRDEWLGSYRECLGFVTLVLRDTP